MSDNQLQINVKDILQQSTDAIVKQCVAAAEREYSHVIYSTVAAEVKKVIEEEFQNGLADEVRAQVAAARPAILAEVQKACADIAVKIGENLITAATNGLGQSWNRSKLIEAVFK